MRDFPCTTDVLNANEHLCGQSVLTLSFVDLEIFRNSYARTNGTRIEQV